MPGVLNMQAHRQASGAEYLGLCSDKRFTLLDLGGKV